MTFDHERNTWVKAIGVMRTSQTRPSKDRNSNTDDDPFANIPDLSFDEKVERKSKPASQKPGLDAHDDDDQGVTTRAKNSSQHPKAISGPIRQQNGEAPTLEHEGHGYDDLFCPLGGLQA